MICDGCTFINFPYCAIQSIITSTAIEDIIEGKQIKKTIYPVCHKNAQSIDGNKLIKGDSCDNCSLCDFLCIKRAFKNPHTGILEKIIFSDLNRFNMYISHLLPHCLVGSEIRAKGHFREKRIDIVIKSGNKIYFVKALSQIDKIPFYSRSYDELVDYYSSLYSRFIFKKMLIIPQKLIDESRSFSFDYCSINDMIKDILE